MKAEPSENEVAARARAYLVAGGCILLDCVYLALWAASQFLVDAFVRFIEPHAEGFGQWTLWVFQGLLFIATLAWLGMYLYSDLQVTWIRTRQRIKVIEAQREAQTL